MGKGTVCEWDDEAGYGFIDDPDSLRVYGRDVFLHAAQIDRNADSYKRRRKLDIVNGDKVTFLVELDRGKPRAIDIEITEKCGKREHPFLEDGEADSKASRN